MSLIPRAKRFAKDCIPPLLLRRWQEAVSGPRLAREHAAAMDAFYGKLIPANSLCFDIGANVGNRIASFRRSGFRVVALEPQPSCFSVLQTKFGGDAGVTLINKAVGSAAGEATMTLSDDHIYSSMSDDFIDKARKSARFGEATWNKKITVEVVTLDQLIAEHGRPNFIKVDVEGFEAEVVRGLSSPVGMISLEWLPTLTETTVDCLSALGRLGPIKCNVSFGERMQLAAENWIETDDLVRALRLLGSESSLWGDVYVRFD